jgi:hypothetical protein
MDDRDFVEHHEPELDDPEEDEEQRQEDERELDQALAAFLVQIAAATPPIIPAI